MATIGALTMRSTPSSVFLVQMRAYVTLVSIAPAVIFGSGRAGLGAVGAGDTNAATVCPRARLN